jgi:NAD(P)-dependent dehydrogenase (short-subunit alcohol dehydrogenase family)
MANNTEAKTALIVGASRSLGLRITEELLGRGWDVIATERRTGSEGLELLRETYPSGGLTIETLDMTEPSEIEALKERLDGTSLDLLFVNAGITNDDEPVGAVSTDDFVRVMVTNALAPMRVIETLESLVAPAGTIGVMSSRQGSISFNTAGGHEVYRASKSALNQLVRSYAARTSASSRTLLLVHPGWVQTELGGHDARLTVEESACGVADVLEDHGGDGGLQFIDYQGQSVPW